MRMFQKMWHGIDLTTMPAAFSDPTKPVSSEFYAQFYAALASGAGTIDPLWLQAKRRLGQAIERDIISAWQKKLGRPPHILALGTGKGCAECVWYEQCHKVTFHDCQEDSLKELRQSCPNAGFLVGDFEKLVPAERYDLITMLTIDYVMNRQEFVELLSRAARWLTADGQLVVFCASTLSIRQFVVEVIKRSLGRYRNRQQVFWGYWRTPAEFFRVARAAGLRVADVYRFGDPLRKAGRLTRKLPPLRDAGLIVTMSLTGKRSVQN